VHTTVKELLSSNRLKVVEPERKLNRKNYDNSGHFWATGAFVKKNSLFADVH
jgi:hypothetical protein